MSLLLRFIRRDFHPSRLPFMPLSPWRFLGSCHPSSRRQSPHLTSKAPASAHFTDISAFCGDALSIPDGVSIRIRRIRDTKDSAPPAWRAISPSKSPPQRPGPRKPVLFYVPDVSTILRRGNDTSIRWESYVRRLRGGSRSVYFRPSPF